MRPIPSLTIIFILGIFLLAINNTQVNALETYEIGDENDDTSELGNGTFNLNNANIKVYSHPDNTSSGYKSSGIRFENLRIQQGMTINSAFIEFFIVNEDNANVFIFAQDNDNALDFGVNQNVLDTAFRPRTDNFVEGDNDDIGIDIFENTQDLRGMFQEVIDRPGWVENNAVVILLIPQTDEIKKIRYRAYDGNPAQAPTLFIDFGTWSVIDQWDDINITVIPRIETTEHPLVALPRSTILIRENLLFSPTTENINATISFSDNFILVDGYPENDNTLNDNFAEWFVGTRASPGSYTFSIVWGFDNNGTTSTLLSDTFTIALKYPSNEVVTPELGMGIGMLGVAIALVALGFALRSIMGEKT